MDLVLFLVYLLVVASQGFWTLHQMILTTMQRDTMVQDSGNHHLVGYNLVLTMVVVLVALFSGNNPTSRAQVQYAIKWLLQYSQICICVCLVSSLQGWMQNQGHTGHTRAVAAIERAPTLQEYAARLWASRGRHMEDLCD
jgi:hypothetical protein